MFPVNGLLLFLLLASAPLAVLLSVILRGRYRKSITRLMKYNADELNESFPGVTRRSAETRELIINEKEQKNSATSRPKPSRNLAARYAIAGFAHGAVATIVYFILEDIAFLPIRTLVVWMVLAWPSIPVALYVAGFPRRTVLLSGFVWAVVAIVIEPSAAFLLAWMVGIAVLAGIALANRKLRSIALPMFATAMVFVASAIFFLEIALLLVPTIGQAGLVIAVLVALVLAILISLAFIILIGRLYSSGHSSDLMLQTDAWWLLVTLWELIQLVGSHGALSSLVLLAFLAYRMLIRSPFGLPLPTQAPQRLLLLRTFGFRQRQEHLMSQVLRHWRHFGPITMIGADDLATETLDPPELSAFLTNRLRNLFIRSAADLDARLGEPIIRAKDGLYPVEDLYCHDNTWRPVIRRLMIDCHTIIMDVRGFSPDNQGCVFELEQLVQLVPPEGIILITDTTTNTGFLKETVVNLWHKHIKLSSNNSPDGKAKLTLYPLRGDNVNDLNQLRDILLAQLDDR